MSHAPLAVTAGEPGGIGGELIVRLAERGEAPARDWQAVCDPDWLAQQAARLGADIEVVTGGLSAPGRIGVRPVALRTAARPGVADPGNADYVLQTIDVAVDGCLSGTYSAMVTAPLHKASIIAAGHAGFTGHTEYLAARCGSGMPVMLLVAGKLRVALATTHLPLREVADAITTDGLGALLGVLLDGLSGRFACARPRVLVAGLNPHAGEGGHLGCEEIEVIAPVCAALRAAGHDVVGPLPADTLFTPRLLEGADAVLAMYHDQGLPVLKHVGFGHAVNVTLGLPIVRTSVDHGTALDIAGRGVADPGSLFAAFDLACDLTA